MAAKPCIRQAVGCNDGGANARCEAIKGRPVGVEVGVEGEGCRYVLALGWWVYLWFTCG